ncbi:MAG: hypothetical protein PHT59_08060, partial [Candidatus Omnitrophica bacterium]|nr:hypothetical protein [Candidatus Omnitrophota bacterium]
MRRLAWKTTARAVVCSGKRMFPAFAFALALIFSASLAVAVMDMSLFGPKKYERGKGKPTSYTDSFGSCPSSDQAILRVTNGDSKRTRVKSARIYVNSVKVASEHDFKTRAGSF